MKVTGLSLSAGRHTLVIARKPGDSGNVNIDSLALTAPGAAYPSPNAVATPCAFGTACEAENGKLEGGAKLATDHGGYSGTGFVAGLENTAAKDSISLTNVPQDGQYALHVRYANGTGGARTISVNGINQTLAADRRLGDVGGREAPRHAHQGRQHRRARLPGRRRTAAG